MSGFDNQTTVSILKRVARLWIGCRGIWATSLDLKETSTMEFLITHKNKLKAKKRRKKYEKKWQPLRIIAVLMLLISIVSFITGIFFISSATHMDNICGWLFAICLIAFVSIEAFIANVTSHWITTRLNERIWIDGDMLNHFIQTAFAAGLNSRNADERGYLFSMDIGTIFDAKYDEKSGRVEFKVYGKGYHFSDVDKNLIDKEWELKKFPAVFYDYTEPGLVKTLEGKGVVFERTTLDFLIRDAGI